EHTSELQSLTNLVCRLLLEKKKSALRSEEHTSELQSLTNLVCRLLLLNKTYDVTQAKAGAELFFTTIPLGSIATKERVIARASGEELKFEVVSVFFFKTSGVMAATTSSHAQFFRV